MIDWGRFRVTDWGLIPLSINPISSFSGDRHAESKSMQASASLRHERNAACSAAYPSPIRETAPFCKMAELLHVGAKSTLNAAMKAAYPHWGRCFAAAFAQQGMESGAAGARRSTPRRWPQAALWSESRKLPATLLAIRKIGAGAERDRSMCRPDGQEFSRRPDLHRPRKSVDATPERFLASMSTRKHVNVFAPTTKIRARRMGDAA